MQIRHQLRRIDRNNGHSIRRPVGGQGRFKPGMAENAGGTGTCHSDPDAARRDPQVFPVGLNPLGSLAGRTMGRAGTCASRLIGQRFL